MNRSLVGVVIDGVSQADFGFVFLAFQGLPLGSMVVPFWGYLI